MTEEERKAKKGNWDEDFKDYAGGASADAGSTSDQRKLVYLDLKNAGHYQVRLVGSYVTFLQHWNPIRIRTHADYKGKDPLWNAGFYPRLRYAINVIDRADGKLKILEGGRQIFKVFAEAAAANHIDPAGSDAPDFTIKVTIPIDPTTKQPNKRQKTYVPSILINKSPFTKEEVEMFTKEKLFPLTSIYRAASLETIQRSWDNLPADQKIAPKKTGTKEANMGATTETTTEEANEEPAETVVEAAPADDMFAESGDKDSTNLF